MRRSWEEIVVPEAPLQSNLRWKLHLEKEEKKRCLKEKKRRV